jgi:DUF1680 family protein
MTRRTFAAAISAAFGTRTQSERPAAEQATPAAGARGYASGLTRFVPLPPGSTSPDGWLSHYLRINADGWVLQYARARMPEVWGRYWNRTSNPKLGFTDHDEWINPPDYGAYFGNSLVRYASVCPNSAAAKEAVEWIEKLIASQDDDGYIGGFTSAARWQNWIEVFVQSMLLESLLHRYRATGDQRCLKTSERTLKLIIRVFETPPKASEPGIFKEHGTIVVRQAAALYELTGQPEYRQFAKSVLDRCGRVNDYLAGGDKTALHHNVVEAEHVGLPAAVYEITGDEQYLQASRAAWQMMQRYLSPDGTPFGNEEIFRHGSRANAEHCGAVEWMITSHSLARITGEVKYADAVERAMHNGYAAPKSPDGMTLGYMHSPNQLVASEWSQPHDNDGDVDWWASRQHYSSAHEPLCCNSNGPRGLPFFVESMVWKSGDGLAIGYYGPCRVKTRLDGAGEVWITMVTNYPFEDEVTIKVRSENRARFPVDFRIPGWCVQASAEVDGQHDPLTAKPGTFLRLELQWDEEQTVKLRFTNQVEVLRRKRPEFRIRAQCAAVDRGGLLFSLPVAAEWLPFTPPAHAPGKDIRAFRLLPEKNAIWNYALIVDAENPDRSFTLEKLTVPANGKPWDNHPPIGLAVKARRVLNWFMEGESNHPLTPGFPFTPMELSKDVENVVLVPFGSTRLRMTYLPIIDA